MSKPPQDLLQPLLRDAEAELRRRLHEACEAEARGIENESASEIRQLEDALLAAAVAAENTLTLRRYIKRHDASRSAEGDAAPAGANAAASTSRPTTTGAVVTGLREFTDRAGQSWRAWAVTPGLSRMGRTKHFLGDFQLGWVCFENPAAGARRRLPGHPDRWSELNDQELDTLLNQAITVRERLPKKKTDTPAV